MSSRRYVFTCNNYTDESIALLAKVDCKYMIYGKEVGESGTPHLQGYLIFEKETRIGRAIKLLPGCHVEIALGTTEQAVAYCKKDGEITERGEVPINPGIREKDRWEAILSAARDGRIQDIPAREQFLYMPKILSHRRFDLSETECQHQWFWGASGTGKSRKARDDHPDHYLKMANKWWDGYSGQEVVIIDDFDKVHAVLCHHLKIWGDRYAFPAEIKGGKVDIRPRLIIITSNYHPSDIWENEQDLQPILRRFHPVQFASLNSTMTICSKKRPHSNEGKTPLISPNFNLP